MDTMRPPLPEELDANIELEGSAHNDEKPQTAEELFRTLQAEGFFDAWKERPDNGDRVEQNRAVRRLPDTCEEETMTAIKPSADEYAEVADAVDEIDDDDEWSDLDSLNWGWDEPKRPLTAKDLLESGLVGLWKDRTDIGDTLEFARELRRQSNARSRD